jgi:hypothetical protein
VKYFNTDVFLYSFPIAVGVAIALAFSPIFNIREFSIPEIIVFIIISIFASAALATILASYKYPLMLNSWMYRGVMRRLAKKAIRSSTQPT